MNQLFPVFFKLQQLNTLLVGGGEVGIEKISALLKNSPNARITVVAPSIRPEIVALARIHKNVELVFAPFHASQLNGQQLVIAGTANRALNEAVWKAAKAEDLLINVADTPELCDFYLSSIVQKGDLKLAISTNGKSPTLAKKMRLYFEELLPDTTDSLLNNLQVIRSRIQGDFTAKLNQLNKITADLVFRETDHSSN